MIDRKADVLDNRVMRQRVAFVSALFAIFLFVLPRIQPKAFAQAWFLSDPQSFGQTLEEAESSGRVQKEGYDMNTQVNMMNSLVCLISGCGTNPQSSLHYNKSALASINGLILSMYSNPPARTYYAIEDFGQSLGFLPKVYAQGVGFSGLAPLLPVWKVFRNIAYVLLAIVMIVIGFMVMFRRKIDPKTVVTVQNALPRIVLTLLLITFSYAIVGVLIDLMYVVLFLALGLFTSTELLPAERFSPFALGGGTFGAQKTVDVITRGNLFQVFHFIFPGWAFSIFDMANKILTGSNWDILAQAVLIIPSFLFGLLLSLAILFIFIRLFIMFLSAYVQIILALIFGPIQILIGAVPGVDGFGGWIKNLVANIAVFPIAGVMFMLSIVFAEAATKGGGASNTFWAPPYYTLANQSVTAITALFSIGVLMMIPSLVGTLKKAIKAQGIPAGPGAILGPMGGVVQGGLGVTSQFYYTSQIWKNRPKWLLPGKA
ncbi:MAG: hypothetical protein HY376_03885 [Candidatus Blackburnbacteria bacterium]|nr:hypothetical protein [Candidatus Blackburnbacteria bacterium]